VSDVFREVDEELRRDRLLALWKRFGPYLIGAAAGLVLVVAGRAYWTDYIDSKRQAESLAYDEALATFQSDTSIGRSALEAIVGGGNDGYAALAQFQLAAELQSSGHLDESVAQYESLSADGALSGRLRGLASLMMATLYIDQGRELEARQVLISLVADNPTWRLSATEFIGFLDFRAGNLEEARSVFVSLSGDQAAPQAMQNRAKEMLSLLDTGSQPVDPEAEQTSQVEEES
jgi:hypothetical protein